MLAWSDQQRRQIAGILETHPVASNRCATAAREILPTARALEFSAHALVIRPNGFAIYIQPKNLSVRWAHHVTVAVAQHCVDALTEVDGYLQATYLERYFHHPDAHHMRPVLENEWEEL